MNESKMAEVAYQVATYSGTLYVPVGDDDDDNDVIKAKARAQLVRKVGMLPYGYESFQIITTY